MENEAFLLEAVFAAGALFRPREPEFRVEVENQGEVGPSLADNLALEAFDQLHVAAAGNALIDSGRIHEAIAQDQIAAIERRPDRFAQVRFPRRIVEQGLGGRRPSADRADDEEGTDVFGSGRAAGFAGQDDVPSLSAQGFGEIARMRALAGALATFKGDETAGHVSRRRPYR